MAMVVVMEVEIESGTMAVVDGSFLFLSSPSRCFSSRGASLYLGAFTKVVLFDEAKAASTIRAQLYGRTRMVPPYSWSLCSLESPLEPWPLWVVWNLVYLTLML